MVGQDLEAHDLMDCKRTTAPPCPALLSPLRISLPSRAVAASQTISTRARSCCRPAPPLTWTLLTRTTLPVWLALVATSCTGTADWWMCSVPRFPAPCTRYEERHSAHPGAGASAGGCDGSSSGSLPTPRPPQRLVVQAQPGGRGRRRHRNATRGNCVFARSLASGCGLRSQCAAVFIARSALIAGLCGKLRCSESDRTLWCAQRSSHRNMADRVEQLALPRLGNGRVNSAYCVLTPVSRCRGRWRSGGRRGVHCLRVARRSTD
jgi:hypothetical protein